MLRHLATGCLKITTRMWKVKPVKAEWCFSCLGIGGSCVKMMDVERRVSTPNTIRPTN